MPGNAALVRACWARMITTSRSWIGNRQAVLADLGHVVHEDRGRPAFTVVADVHIEVQAVEGKRAQLGGAPAEHGAELHRGGDGGAGEFVETMMLRS